jgi:ADP-ribosyltransferase exoenzyme
MAPLDMTPAAEILASRVGPHGYIHGWIKAGAAETTGAEKYITSMAGKVKPRELDNYNVGAYERDTLTPAFHYTPEQGKAIGRYTEQGYGEINTAARAGGAASAEVQAISRAMQPLPEDLILLREVSGHATLSHLNPGDIIHDEGFSSTTLIGRGRFAIGKSDTTVMHIMTPKGTPAVWADPVSGFPEDEIILDRGQPMIVMKKQQRSGRTDVTDVYLLVLPKGTVK